MESKSTETIKEIKTEKPAVRISSLLVVGEVQHNFQYYKSNQIDGAIKECVRSLKSTTRTVTKGSGKTSYEDAKKLAEKETETYILWLGFLSTVDDYGNEYIESLQYAVLTPKTAKVLTRGEIVPGENKVVAPGGVLQNRGRLSATVQMLLGVRQVAEILLRGWLD